MGWIYTQFSVANGTAGGELQLPYRMIRVSRYGDVKYGSSSTKIITNQQAFWLAKILKTQ